MSRHSMVWVRANGQQEMRDNLAAMLADAGMTRAALCREAGLPYSRLTAAMSSHGWFYEADVEAIANVLDVSVDEIRGDSLWRDQRDRYIEFDHRPGSNPAEQTDDELDARHLARGLCCICGTLRILHATWDNWLDDAGQTRHVRTATCRTCDAETKHAVLNNGDDRNADEEEDRRPTRADIARRDLQAFIDRVAEFGVDVHYDTCVRSLREKGYAATCEYDESKSRWRFEVDPNLPPRAQLKLLEYVWSRVAVGSFENSDLNPRDGIAITPFNDMWSSAIDDLVDDIKRHLHVEKARLAQHVRDHLADQEGAR